MPTITKIFIKLTPKCTLVFIASPMHVQFLGFIILFKKIQKNYSVQN